MRLTGRQCDQKSSVGDQLLRTGRQWATHLFFPQPFNLKGKQHYLWTKDTIYSNRHNEQTHDSLIANCIATLDYFKACFSKRFSLTLENFEMATPVQNRPIMHCKPLSTEYVMYAYGLCLFYLILRSLYLATFFTTSRQITT